MRRPMLLLVNLALLLVITGVATAQEQKKSPPISPSARLAAAKNVFVKNVAGGSDLPFNVISGAIESWPRFIMVDSPEKADIVIEVSAPIQTGMSMYGSQEEAKAAGHKDRPETEGRQLDISDIRMRVYDPRSKIVLWSGVDQMKGFAAKQRTKADKIVEASQRLFSKFHDAVEPPPAPK